MNRYEKIDKNAVLKNRESKICESIEESIKRSGLKDGMTISFHHAFRGGD